jgi:hypothetical protein
MFGAVRQNRTAVLISMVIFSASVCPAQTPSDERYSVVDRGPFFNVLQRTVSATNVATGEISQQVQSYTELGDGTNYLSNGQWVAAHDVIEVTSTGAEATHGQMTARFDSDITSVGAISITTPAGEVFQSHPLGLFYADSASGKLAQIGSVQTSEGTLYPPNTIVFSNVLSGVRADLMLVWAKNGFEQNLVLKQAPPPPSSFGFSNTTTTLQLWTVMDSCPVPKEQRSVVLDSGLVDHILIFGGSWFPVGAAFTFGNTPSPSSGQPTPIKLLRPSDAGAVPVAKTLVNIAGQQVLVEEVRYVDLAAALNQLPQASLLPKPDHTLELGDRARFPANRLWPKPVNRPMQLAMTQYRPKGVVLDYVSLDSSAYGYTFASGTTYYIPEAFSVGPGGATFQQGACLKFGANSALTLNGGPVSFPSSGAKVVFTSKDDNGYGQIISGSTASPGYAASPALWLYYYTTQTTIQNPQIRWAVTGIEYDESSGVTTSPSLNSSVFQNCQHGVNVNMPNDELSLSEDTYCNTGTPLYVIAGSSRGSMTADCGVVSVAMVNDPNRDLTGIDTNKNSQSECSFAVLDSTNIVAAFMNTHFSEFGLGSSPFPGIPSPRMTSWATSGNNGASFTDNGPILPVSTVTNASTVVTNGASDPTHGDAGDPDVVYDPTRGTYGTVYLIVNASREYGYLGPRLWISTNKGTNFTLVNTNIPGSGLVSDSDGPRIMVASNGDLYATGAGSSSGQYTTWVAHSTDGGLTWDGFQKFDTNGVAGGAKLLQAPDGTIYAFWLKGNGASSPVTNVFRYAWLAGTNWSYSTNLGITLNSSSPGGSGNPLRFSGDDTNDFFISTGAPQPAFANGRIYVAYADLQSPTSSVDRGDIFVAEATTNSNHWLGTPIVRKVNNDRTSTDQWNPSIASDPAGTQLFIGYYSRQNDPVTNSWIMAYGAKAYITNGLAAATFECFPISSTGFLPVFAGTNAAPNNWAFDPVWPQRCVCLDTNAIYAGGSSCSEFDCPHWPNSIIGFSTTDSDIHFCADDYTWAVSDNAYFYFAWCDRSRTNGVAPNIRPDEDVKLAKVRQ